MKHKRWQAVVMIAFAWIFWTRVATEGGADWIPLDSFDKKTECTAEGMRRVKTFAKKQGVTVHSPLSFRDSNGVLATMHCFPETFDPRPKK